MIDLHFNYETDSRGNDPDTFSKTLNDHHYLFWNKILPNGKPFGLYQKRIGSKYYLAYKQDESEILLSSDSFIHPLFYAPRISAEDKPEQGEFRKIAYKNRFPYETILQEIPEEIDDFHRTKHGLGGYIIFPGQTRNGKQTMNQSRGIQARISDRFDLTLECIKRFYEKSDDLNPLSKTLELYADFFNLFVDFKGYVDFFLLNGLVSDDYKNINYWLPFDNFQRSPLPQSSQEYLDYKKNILAFKEHRTKMMEEYLKSNQNNMTSKQEEEILKASKEAKTGKM